MAIHYIDEKGIRELVESLVDENKDKGFIKSPEGFAQHHVDVSRNGAMLSCTILTKGYSNPRDPINPEMNRVASGVHDVGKIFVGYPGHEVWGSNWILENGDGILVVGGSKAEREKTLEEMASLLPGDYSFYEEFGGERFPEGNLYEEYVKAHKGDEKISSKGFFKEYEGAVKNKEATVGIIKGLLERLNMSFERFAWPVTMNQKVVTMSDLTSLGGEEMTVKERIEESIGRYSIPNSPYENPVIVDVSNKIKSRILLVEEEIRYFMR